MVPNTSNIFLTVFYGVFGWFNDLMTAMAGLPMVMGVIVAMLAIRFIIYPSLKPGVGGSDSARRRKKKENE